MNRRDFLKCLGLSGATTASISNVTVLRKPPAIEGMINPETEIEVDGIQVLKIQPMNDTLVIECQGKVHPVCRTHIADSVQHLLGIPCMVFEEGVRLTALLRKPGDSITEL